MKIEKKINSTQSKKTKSKEEVEYLESCISMLSKDDHFFQKRILADLNNEKNLLDNFKLGLYYDQLLAIEEKFDELYELNEKSKKELEELCKKKRFRKDLKENLDIKTTLVYNYANVYNKSVMDMYLEGRVSWTVAIAACKSFYGFSEYYLFGNIGRSNWLDEILDNMSADRKYYLEKQGLKIKNT